MFKLKNVRMLVKYKESNETTLSMQIDGMPSSSISSNYYQDFVIFVFVKGLTS